MSQVAIKSPLAVIADGIPAELRSLNQWVLWRLEQRDGQWTKPPYQPNGRKAKSTDRATWGTFDDILAAYQAGGFDGIGFVLSADDPFVIVDLDGARDSETGEAKPWSTKLRARFKGKVPDPLQLIARMQTAVEVSPSGTGYHIFCKGTLPPNGRKIGGKSASGDGCGDGCPDGLEVYSSARYIAITGQLLPSSPSTIADCNGKLTELHAAVFGEKRAATAPPSTNRTTATNGGQTAKQIDDDRVFAIATNADNGAKFQRLWNGETAGYLSDSEADLALANILAFWAGNRADQVERLLRRSGLVRDKWDKHPTYLKDTVAKALDGRTEFYDWARQDNTASITNVRHVEEEGKKSRTIPLPMTDVIASILDATGNWPRRVGTELFAHDDRGIHQLDKASSLFGYLAAKCGLIDWRQVAGSVSKEETFQELRRAATGYDAIEELPHYPAIAQHYYACDFPKPSDGAALTKLLGFFCLETPIDRQLLIAGLATPLWGGPPATRPACMITSKGGRGKGKTKLAQMIARVYGGLIDISPSEDIGTVKQRLLSPDAVSKRIALLDNVKTTRFSWGELEALITADPISGKRMYVGEGSRPNYLCWMITLNGASLSTDMAQRVFEIRLREPEYDGGWEERVRAFVDANQQSILGDLTAVLQRAQQPMRKHTRWATWERAVLSRIEDPDACLATILERRGQVDVEEEEGEIVEAHFASRLVKLEYDVERADVFIPNTVAARWLAEATGDNRRRVTAASRALRQMIDEGKVCQLVTTRVGGTGARGFRWVGKHADMVDVTFYDLERRIVRRIEQQQQEQTTREREF